jgi:hypothetical protein
VLVKKTDSNLYCDSNNIFLKKLVIVIVFQGKDIRGFLIHPKLKGNAVITYIKGPNAKLLSINLHFPSRILNVFMA